MDQATDDAWLVTAESEWVTPTPLYLGLTSRTIWDGTSRTTPAP